ncbi:VOC family protein [Roseococcus sp. DSY-14]|uniref:VOC family protein n=1 Tax=Roseococcus sp. DSY-14 TaxID=3369650 RepID=UPI00387B668E
MFSHVTVGANDYAGARAFYDAVLAPLGVVRFQEWPDAGWAAYRRKGEAPTFWIAKPKDGAPATRGNGAMTAFAAHDEAAVDAAHAAGLAAGGRCEGPPGPRPQYGDFYAAYLRDPEGNKLCIVVRRPSPAGAPV